MPPRRKCVRASGSRSKTSLPHCAARGYNNPQNSNALGSFQLRGDDAIFIRPGSESYLAPDAATITSSGDAIQAVTAENGAALAAYKLEPQLITALSEDKNRTKRRMVTYKQVPPRMVEAVTAIEDRRFFEHGGINYARTLKCAWQDFTSQHMSCGGSTLTQQLARGFFLTPDKKISRKLQEIMITYQLEARFSKQQIFEMYANYVPLGQRGSFAVNGFGEAAQAFFGKDLRQLDTAECAMLAGMIQRPSFFSPYKHPDRAMERRNIVLDSMVDTGALTEAEAARFKAEPIRLAPPNVDASEAPYFVDLVHDQLIQRLGEQGVAQASLRIYTSLDPELQRAASAAVEAGMHSVDELIRRLHGKADNTPVKLPQVALVALNPHTGQILALVGGRNYAVSQLDHALAERPTGSIFKPFVYASAYNTSLKRHQPGRQRRLHRPHQAQRRPAGLRRRLHPRQLRYRVSTPAWSPPPRPSSTRSTSPPIALAQLVGYSNVASLARSAGITNAKATPSVAIGTYNATPIDMAGAYTTFANGGVHLKPWALASVRKPAGRHRGRLRP